MSKGRPFTKLKKQIENLFDSQLKMQLKCFAYPVRSQYGSTSIPRFYVQLGKEIIWDFPKDSPLKKISHHYWVGLTGISPLIREYIDAPITNLLNRKFKSEHFGLIMQYVGMPKQDLFEYDQKLTDLFKAADRRIGKEKLLKWATPKEDPRINYILLKRFGIDLAPEKLKQK